MFETPALKIFCKNEVVLKNCSFVFQFAEKLVSLLPTSCKFTYFGCTVAVDKESKTEHQKHCQYRDVQCCFRKCQKRVPFCQIFTHICSSHFVRTKKLRTIYKRDFFVKQIKDWCFSIPIIFSSERHKIFFEMIRQKETWHAWTFYQGTIEEADKVMIQKQIKEEPYKI